MSRRPENHPDSVLAVRRLNKSFGEIQVLFGVDFDVKAGEMHALLGENGAGKSTLVKVLSGFLEPTSGHVLLDGKTVTLPPNGQAEKLGIVLIHQEFNLAEQQTVEENMFLGREITRGGLLDKKTMRARCAEVLETLQCPIDPTTRVSDLSVSDKQMVEIAKALSRDARVLIMDEPTAVLTGEESKALFEQVKRLKAAGVAVIFISHKLDEIKAEADRVTVLRDGQWIATKPVDELTQDGMARLMVGRELSDMFPPKNEPDVDAPIVLKADGIRVPGAVRQASFELREGEILGFAGLIGSGRTAVFEALLGLRPMAAGTVEVNGQPTRLKSLAQAADRRIAYLTKDRKGKGLLVGMQLRPNLTLLALRQFVRSLLIDEKSEQKALDKAIRRFDIRARDRKALVGELSGGNQQKLLLGKVMEIDPEIIIVDEPTRGIDVGTKQQIYHFIAALAAEGKSIVLISSEMLEIIGMSHRVAVMHAGQLTGVLEGDAIEEHEIMRYAAGLKEIKTMNSSSPSLAFPQSLAIDFRALGPLVALVALFILGAVINDAFYSAGNLTNILTRSAFIGIIAVGATFVITAGGIDLSVGSMAAFISGCMIVVMNGLIETLGTGWPTILAGIAISIVLGTAAGALNGRITTRGKIEAFIVTLGTMGIYRSLVTYIADGGTLSLDFAVRGVYRPFYYGDILGIPVPVLVFAAVAVLGYLALNKTRFGRHCFAIGSNEHVARYSAVSVERVRTATYIVQGLCVSVATIIYVPRLGSASASTGVLWELEAIAAVIIGGTVLKGGYGRIGGTVVGAIMLTMIGNILNLTDAISNYLNGTVQGIIIIVAVYLQRGSWRQKK